MRNEAIEAAAEWFCVKTFDTALNQDNGDNSATGGMTFMLGNLLSMKSKEQLSENARQEFKEELIRLMNEEPQDYRIVLSVDYDPCELLYNACKATNVPTSILPIKTTCIVERDGSAWGSFKYGGAHETLYTPSTHTS